MLDLCSIWGVLLALTALGAVLFIWECVLDRQDEERKEQEKQDEVEAEKEEGKR